VKHGIETGAGVIDSDYRKDVGVVLHNFSNTPFNYTKGMRIAQLLITPILTPNIVCENTDEFDDTKRGGYGSTGIH
jgi:dUTP pyrophosphatase